MTILSNAVHRDLQQIGLLVLKQARDAGTGGAALGQLPASAVLETLVRPPIARLSMATRDDPSPEHLELFTVSLTTTFERQKQTHAGSDILVPDPLTATDQLPTFLRAQEQRLVSDPTKVRAAWQAGIDLLDAVIPAAACQVRSAVILIAGINGPFGEVAAFSSPIFPGCIAFGTNNPPVLLAEEILHEACHVRLWSRLAVDNRLSEIFSDLPAIHSPFTDCLRPAIRVLHGFVSYAAVLRYWKGLKSMEYDAAAFGLLPGDAAAILIERRINTLRIRIAIALGGLRWILERVAAEAFEQVVEEIVGCTITELSLPEALPEADQHEYDAVVQLLEPVSLAEYHLAAAGAKVSRMVLPLAVASRLAMVNVAKRTLLVSGEAVRSDHDPRLGNFSNTVSRTIDLLDAGPADDVYVYVSNDPGRSLAGWRLDRINEASELFGIPSCCARFFRDHWDESQTLSHGDLFETMLTRSCPDEVVRMHWACNAAAMYFGRSLCWHFPCKPDCPATISAISERRLRLSEIDQSLTRSLVNWMTVPFVWSKALGYGSLPADASLSTSLDSAVWLNAGLQYRTDETIAMWLAAAGGDKRRLIVPTSIGPEPR